MSLTIDLSPDQLVVHDAIVSAWEDGRKLLRAGGYAGTGKTTTLAAAMSTLNGKGSPSRAYCCYTGKAADVLRRKLAALGVLREGDYIGTIHGLIYEPETDGKGNVIDWILKDHIDQELIIIDEASMVGGDLWKDLNSYGLPIIAVGDHGQLPPIGGNGIDLMKDVDVRLEKIHRQAEGNPIIRVSMMARLDGDIPYGVHGDRVRKIDDASIVDKIDNPKEIMFLGAFNNWRCRANLLLRRRVGAQSSTPCAGEKVICLRNMREKGIFNGMIGFIDRIDSHNQHAYATRILMDGGVVYNGLIAKSQFGLEKTLEQVPGNSRFNPIALFDWGYALTVHKSQGSEADRVVLFEQRNSYQTEDEWRRWLYTGVTRAREDLTIVKPRRF